MPGTRFFVGRPSGKPFAVHLSLAVVERLGLQVMEAYKALPRRGLEVGGVLRGEAVSTESGTVLVVDGFEPLACEHERGPSFVLSEAECGRLGALAGSGRVAGYYRSHTRADEAPTPQDLAIMADCFPDPRQVFLLIKPVAGGSPTGYLYFWEDGKIGSRPAFEFPFRRVALETAETVEGPRGARHATAPRATKARRRFPVVYAAGAALFTLAFLILMSRAWQGPTPPPTAPQRKAPAAKLPEAKAPAQPDLALAVSREGRSLKVSWDRQAPVIQSAPLGILWIEDGSRKSQLKLDRQQLTGGTIAYWPRGNDVNFRLDVLAPAGTVSESVRFFTASPFGPQQYAARREEDDEDPEPPRVAARTTAPRPVAAPKPAEPAHPAPAPAPAAATPQHAAATSPPPGLPVASVSVEPVKGSRIKGILRKMGFLRPSRTPTGKGFVPPAPVRRELPAVPRNLLGEVPVDVRIRVDAEGHVDTAVQAGKDTPADPKLVDAALAAAQRWEFQPARIGERSVPSEMILHFRFAAPAVAFRERR